MAELHDTRSPNRVTVRLGVTIHPNPDNQYETARIDIEVASDALPHEKVDDTVDRIYDYLDNKLAEKVTEARGD